MKSYWRFHIFRWHTINLIPMLCLSSVVNDEDYRKAIGRHLELTLFGWVISLGWPSKKAKRMRYWKPIGPMYSRKRKCWYRYTETDNPETGT